MTRFNDVGTAKKSLKDNGVKLTKWDTTLHKAISTDPHSKAAEHVEDFARIAEFLSNPARLDTALETVSEKLWTAYIALPGNTPNKFTSALGDVARAANFTFQERFKPTMANMPVSPPVGITLIAGDPQLGYMLRKKLFWKDSMDLRHGEHTHSLQWLAIHEGAHTVTSVAELYSYCADYRLQSANDRGGDRSVTMWQWLADCFAPDMNKAAADTTFKNGEKLQSDSGRAPQVIMDRLMLGNPADKQSHFISTYLYARYKKRGWLKEVESFDQAAQKKVKTVTAMQGEQIKKTPEQMVATKKWLASPSSKEARMLRNTDYKPDEDESGVRKYYSMTFHGLPGKLYI